MNFERRACLSEWMDEPCSFEEFRGCLRDLEKVNRLTLAYRPTLRWLEGLLQPQSEPVHIVDVGCGGGDMLRTIARWAKRKRITVRLTGIDLNPYAAPVAREFTDPACGIHWVTGDAFSYPHADAVDLVISSLFTHHLTDDEIVHFVCWMEENAQKGWFINDLHRERLPYLGFKALAAIMRWHPFVCHDGPISIRRAFRHGDWANYLSRADVSDPQATLTTSRPARLCVSRVKA